MGSLNAESARSVHHKEERRQRDAHPAVRSAQHGLLSLHPEAGAAEGVELRVRHVEQTEQGLDQH